MAWLMDGTRKKQEGRCTGVEHTPKVHGSESDGPNSRPKSNGNSNSANDAAIYADTAKTTATEQVDGVQKKVSGSTGSANNAVGTAKGVAGGVTEA